MSTYADDRAEQAENALDIRVAALEADRADREITDGPWNYPENGSEPR